jgi:photosystem II stability/assembly factor-like uncharacterized protein
MRPFREHALLLALLLVGGGSTSLRGQTWTPIGPTGGDVRSLAVDPRDPRTVFLGTADGVLYRSVDGGVRWTRLSPGFPKRGQSLDDIVVDPRGRVLVGYWDVSGVGGGVARGEVNGGTYSLLPGIEGESVRALAAAPSDPDVLVAGAIGGVFRSDDGGNTWRRISPAGHAEIRNVESVAIDPTDPAIVYVGTWHLPWKTVDGGRIWRPVHTGMIEDSDVFTMTLDRRTPRTVYATACTGIYRSFDAGGRWTKARGIPSSSRRTRSFAQDPDRPDTFFAGTTEGLFISDDATETWRLATAKDLVVNTIASLPRSQGGTILLGTETSGVLRSEDGGHTWAASNEGFSEHLFSRVLVDGPAGRIVAGVFGDRQRSGVFEAPRPSGPWTPFDQGLEGRKLLSLALDDGEIVAGTDDGVFRSVSHCGLWQRLSTAVDGFESHPRVSDVAVLEGGVLLLATPHGVLRSADHGGTWRRIPLGVAGAVLALTRSPGNRRLALAATPLGVFRSRDAGATWQQVSQPLAGAEIHAMAFLPGHDDVVFAATGVGLLKSVDQGHVWQRRGGGLPLADIAGLALDVDGKTVYASDFTNGGLYRSDDAGESWRPFSSAGLASDRVWTMAVDPATPGLMLAAASTGGLHLLMAGGASGAAAGAR